MSFLHTLPDEILQRIINNLPWYSVIALAGSDKKLRAICASDQEWNHRLQILFHDVNNIEAEEGSDQSGQTLMQRFLHMTGFGRTIDGTSPISSASLCDCIPGCGGRLILRNGNRCPCIIVRSRQLTLRVGALCSRRSRSSSLDSGGFEELRSTLRNHFSFLTFDQLPSLDRKSLRNIDALILCTTEGPPLSPSELENLQSWVNSGGALITSAFSNWSSFGHFARMTVGWLGIVPRQNDTFGMRLEHTIDPILVNSGNYCKKEETRRAEEISHLVTAGPFGQVQTLSNQGETLFQITDNAYNLGAVPLTCKYGSEDLQENQLGNLVYFPPTDLGGQTKRKGRILLCSNFHWLCDESYWMGGFFTGENENSSKVLLLNFIASALAVR